ncbi:MAG: GAF domain-containing sensor histidine kinase [Acidobacteriota bacterium]|nr:GAF domain-containing sensor histidine kinase [Acidobacteriota bacterium]
MNATLSVPAKLEDVLVTYKLQARRRRKPNSYYENVALHALSAVMAKNPDALIDTLLRMAMELCNAGTAGLSMLETLPDGEQIFRWTNLAGVLRDHIGGSTPRNFSPCGVTLDRDAPQLFDHPERYFQYFDKAGVPFVEALVIPIYLGDERPGTIWILSHNDEVKFDSEDVRLMAGLADFTSCALRLTQAYEGERKARIEGAKENVAHKQAEGTLRLVQTDLEATIALRTAQLQKLSSRLIATQDEERRRIARELHDSVGQYLAGIQMVLQAHRRESARTSPAQRTRIQEALGMVESCTAEIRTISYLLHPPLLDEVGLASAISWYVAGFSERSGIKVGLEFPDSMGRLPREMENALFRVVQQSLANIHRHSGSEVAKIRINMNTDYLQAEICDEGRGIPEEMLKGFQDGTRLVGVGMAGMRERVRDMGGRFDIRSGKTGTTVEVRLPLAAASRSAQSAQQ